MKEIFERRSVRSYTDREVTPQEEEVLLKAAMQAPSAGNQQPWHFVVIRSRQTMEKIDASQPYAAMLRQAPMAIVVCGDSSRQKYPYDFWVQDCSAALQNILLEAVHIGLGAVWLGVYPVPERVENIRAILGLPQEIIPLGIVSIGQPAVEIQFADRYQPDRVHQERWD